MLAPITAETNAEMLYHAGGMATTGTDAMSLLSQPLTNRPNFTRNNLLTLQN